MARLRAARSASVKTLRAYIVTCDARSSGGSSPAKVGCAAIRAVSSVMPPARRAAEAIGSPARQDAEEQVLGAHARGAERGRFLARELDGGAGFGRDPQARGSEAPSGGSVAAASSR